MVPISTCIVVEISFNFFMAMSSLTCLMKRKKHRTLKSGGAYRISDPIKCLYFIALDVSFLSNL